MLAVVHRLAISSLVCLILATGCGGPTIAPNVPVDSSPTPPAALQKIYTEHLGQLIGTTQNSLVDLGMTGTDLGSSFERDGKLVFLFGDSRAIVPTYQDDDSAAWTELGSNPLESDSLPTLTWFRDPGMPSRFLSLLIPTINMRGMNVPVEGVARGSTTFVFAAAGFSPALGSVTRSVLAHTEGLALESLVLDHSVASDKFLNVSVIADPDWLWIFGSGRYRQSPVYLARVDPSRLTDRAAWQYFRGYQGDTAQFGESESTARPVVAASCVGELSVRLHPGLGYLMAYNCDQPRGINLRFAHDPWGPWSSAKVIFDPDVDRGYGYFMHKKESAAGYDDGLAEPGREDEWGGEYGPYLIPQWMRSEAAGVFSIVYALSSWNPYQVHLVRSIVAEPGVSASPPPPKGAGLPPATLINGDFAAGDLRGWLTSGDSFAVIPGNDGHWRLTTYVPPKGGGVLGEIWQEFKLDSKTHELRFAVSGGDAAVKLYHGPDVIRASRGRRTNSTETPVRWLLDDLSGETVRLAIVDDLTDSWGFVTVSGFEFVRDP